MRMFSTLNHQFRMMLSQVILGYSNHILQIISCLLPIWYDLKLIIYLPIVKYFDFESSL